MKFRKINIMTFVFTCMSLSVAEGNGDLTVDGTTITNDLAISDLDCTGGALTTDSMGIVSCSDPGCSLSTCFETGLATLTCGDSAVSVGCSNPGVSWTTQSAHSNQWLSVTYGDSLFVAVSWNTSTNQVMSSSDGITWTPRVAAQANDWRSVTYGGGLFVAVSVNGTHRVMTSP